LVDAAMSDVLSCQSQPPTGDGRYVAWADLSLNRDNNFDFLRFALAVLVIFSHSFPLLGLETAEPLVRASRGQLSLGSFAVNGFFVISGFLITMSLARSTGLRDFFRRRALRIYPGFIVAMLFTAFVVAPLGSDGTAPLFSGAQMRHLLFQTLTLGEYRCPGVFTPEQVYYTHGPVGILNGSLWTIRYEFLCYVIVAGLATAGLVKRPKWVLAAFAACLVWALVLAAFKDSLAQLPWLVRKLIQRGAWPRFLAYYLAGVVFYVWRERLPYSHWLALFCAAAVVVGLRLPHGAHWSLPVFGSYLLFYLAYSRWLPVQHFARPGDFSYGIYLYAFAVQQLIVLWLDERWGLTPMKLFAIATAGTLVLAVLSWHGVEKHFLRMKQRKKTEADESQQAATAPVNIEPLVQAGTA
jgi:peptidoglycan/LPS O-acetylase OafA/YrhL